MDDTEREKNLAKMKTNHDFSSVLVALTGPEEKSLNGPRDFLFRLQSAIVKRFQNGREVRRTGGKVLGNEKENLAATEGRRFRPPANRQTDRHSKRVEGRNLKKKSSNYVTAPTTAESTAFFKSFWPPSGMWTVKGP
jgi:hypothetical protein